MTSNIPNKYFIIYITQVYMDLGLHVGETDILYFLFQELKNYKIVKIFRYPIFRYIAIILDLSLHIQISGIKSIQRSWTHGDYDQSRWRIQVGCEHVCGKI